MKFHLIKVITLRFALLSALPFVATGCFKQDTGDCGTNHSLTVRAFDIDGTQLGVSDVGDVKLYVFDVDHRFVELISTQIGQDVSLNVKRGEDVHLVAWGNLAGGNQIYPTPGVGEHKNDLCVSLQTTTRASLYAASPDDLFLGELTISKTEPEGRKDISIYREVGSMAITIKKLKEFCGYSDDNFSVEIHETNSSIDFHGSHSGTMVAYRPDGVFVADGSSEKFEFQSFNLLPSGNISIDVYHGTDLIASVAKDSSGNPITVHKGKQTNVLIDFAAKINVSVSVTEWGVNQVWKDF